MKPAHTRNILYPIYCFFFSTVFYATLDFFFSNPENNCPYGKHIFNECLHSCQERILSNIGSRHFPKTKMYIFLYFKFNSYKGKF